MEAGAWEREEPEAEETAEPEAMVMDAPQPVEAAVRIRREGAAARVVRAPTEAPVLPEREALAQVADRRISAVEVEEDSMAGEEAVKITEGEAAARVAEADHPPLVRRSPRPPRIPE